MFTGGKKKKPWDTGDDSTESPGLSSSHSITSSQTTSIFAGDPSFQSPPSDRTPDAVSLPQPYTPQTHEEIFGTGDVATQNDPDHEIVEPLLPPQTPMLATTKDDFSFGVNPQYLSPMSSSQEQQQQFPPSFAKSRKDGRNGAGDKSSPSSSSFSSSIKTLTNNPAKGFDFANLAGIDIGIIGQSAAGRRVVVEDEEEVTDDLNSAVRKMESDAKTSLRTHTFWLVDAFFSTLLSFLVIGPMLFKTWYFSDTARDYLPFGDKFQSVGSWLLRRLFGLQLVNNNPAPANVTTTTTTRQEGLLMIMLKSDILNSLFICIGLLLLSAFMICFKLPLVQPLLSFTYSLIMLLIEMSFFLLEKGAIVGTLILMIAVCRTSTSAMIFPDEVIKDLIIEKTRKDNPKEEEEQVEHTSSSSSSANDVPYNNIYLTIIDNQSIRWILSLVIGVAFTFLTPVLFCKVSDYLNPSTFVLPLGNGVFQRSYGFLTFEVVSRLIISSLMAIVQVICNTCVTFVLLPLPCFLMLFPWGEPPSTLSRLNITSAIRFIFGGVVASIFTTMIIMLILRSVVTLHLLPRYIMPYYTGQYHHLDQFALVRPHWLDITLFYPILIPLSSPSSPVPNVIAEVSSGLFSKQWILYMTIWFFVVPLICVKIILSAVWFLKRNLLDKDESPINASGTPNVIWTQIPSNRKTWSPKKHAFYFACRMGLSSSSALSSIAGISDSVQYSDFAAVLICRFVGCCLYINNKMYTGDSYGDTKAMMNKIWFFTLSPFKQLSLSAIPSILNTADVVFFNLVPYLSSAIQLLAEPSAIVNVCFILLEVVLKEQNTPPFATRKLFVSAEDFKSLNRQCIQPSHLQFAKQFWDDNCSKIQ